MTPEEQQVAEILIKNATNLENANLTAMAILALLLWDWLISLDREVQHFWRAKWTLGTWLYILNRAIPTISNIIHITTTVVSWSPDVQQRMCHPTLFLLNSLAAVSFAIVQIVMSLRTYALFDCNKPLLFGLLLLSLASCINQLYWNNAPPVQPVVNQLPAPYNGCLLIQYTSPPTWAKYLPLLVFEALLLFLTWYKFIFYAKSGSKALVPKILFRDGFIGFIAVILATIFGITILIVRPRALLTLGQVVAPIIPVLVASHMLLNLRDVMRLSSTIQASQIPSGGTTLPSSNTDSHGTISNFTSSFATSGRKFGMSSITSPWTSTPLVLPRSTQRSFPYDASGDGQPMSASDMFPGESSSPGDIPSKTMELTPSSSWPLQPQITPVTRGQPPIIYTTPTNTNLMVVDDDYHDPYAYGADDQDWPGGGEYVDRRDEYELGERPTLPYRPGDPRQMDLYPQSPTARHLDEEELVGVDGSRRREIIGTPQANSGVSPSAELGNITTGFDVISSHLSPARRPPDPAGHHSETSSVLMIE